MSRSGPIKGQYKPLVDVESDVTIAGGKHMPTEMYGDHMNINPDQFFKDIYNYHQSGGFWAVFLAEFLWMLKFLFVVFIGIELTVCTRWEVLANNSVAVSDWDDVFTPPGQCWATLSLLPALLVTCTVFTLIVQLIRIVRRLYRYWSVRRFCSLVLDMPTSSTGLADLTWVDVQRRLIDCHTDRMLDELGVCHRILRHENYLISMVAQDVLPVRFNLSLTNPPWPYVFLSDGYLYNLRLILFRTPWSPFSTHWHLRSEYKDFSKRYQLADQLGTVSRVLGLFNLLFAPVILLAQLLVFLCTNAERLRYQPGSIMGRRWSNYARLYLRHYNELPHQFSLRIGMAYEPACQYLDCFVSRNLIALAETGAFILGSVSAAFFVMGIVHEQMMHLTGYWAILVAGGLLARACFSFIPDENVARSPQALLVTILGKIHRVRDHWIEQAATYRVCSEFAQLFQYRLSAALEEVFSALITPFLLIFVVPNHTLEIVDFLRNYTVELRDVGDVCSFAQMDVRRHGDPQWRPVTYEDAGDTIHPEGSDQDVPQGSSGGGKIELSLMHFHLNNPTYRLPESSRAYLLSIRRQLMQDIQQPSGQIHHDLTDQPSIVGNVTGPLSSTGLLTSLYSGQGVTQQSIIRSGQTPVLSSARLKKVSHLPGPSYISGDTLGFVGAVTQSMHTSMHSSDPGMARSATSDSTIHKGLSSSLPQQDSSSVRVTDVPNTEPLSGARETAAPDVAPSPVALTQSTSQPLPLEHSLTAYAPAAYTNDPINLSLMAASSMFSTDVLGHPIYRPFTSQIENGSSQHWGVASSIFDNSNSRYGLADVLTADTSASILYMHELAHRRRQQRNLQRSTGPGGNPQSSSLPVGPPDVGSGLAAIAPNIPYQQLTSSGASVRTSTGPGIRLATERSGLASSSRFGYGTTSSSAVSVTGIGSESTGVIRTSLAGRRLPHAAFAEVAEEEDDELAGTSRLSTEGRFRPYHLTGDSLNVVGHRSSGSGSPVGVVTVSGASSARSTRPVDPSSTSHALETEPVPSENLENDTDTEHVWPDLPPTNC